MQESSQSTPSGYFPELIDGGLSSFDESNTFYLTTDLCQGKLKITLKDYIDWIFYEKIYTEEDIGKGQINRKFDLFDIYCALTPVFPQSENDEAKMRQKQHLRVYLFGKTIENHQCYEYSIFKDGVIKIAKKVQLKTKNGIKDEIYRSELCLDLKRQLKQIQILTTKANIERRFIRESIEQQIQKIKIDNIGIKTKLSKCQQQQDFLKKQTQKITSQIQNYQQNNTKIQDSLISKNSQHNNNIVSLSQKVTELQQKKNQMQQNIKSIKQTQDVISTKQTQLIQLTNKIKQEQQNNYNQLKKYSSKVQLYSMADLTTPYIYQFSIFGNLLKFTPVGNSATWTQFLIDEKIPTDKVYKFKTKIAYTAGNGFYISILDRTKHKTSRYSGPSGSANTIYQSFNNSYNSKIVETIVDMKARSIQWKIDSSVISKKQSQNILVEPGREFVVAYQIYDLYTMLEWMGRQITDS